MIRLLFLSCEFFMFQRLFRKISAWRTKRNRFSWRANSTRSAQEQWTWMTLLRTIQLIDVTNLYFILFGFFFQITSRVQQRRNSFCLVLDNKRECWQLFKVNTIDTFTNFFNVPFVSLRFLVPYNLSSTVTARKRNISRWHLDRRVAKKQLRFRPRRMQWWALSGSTCGDPSGLLLPHHHCRKRD